MYSEDDRDVDFEYGPDRFRDFTYEDNRIFELVYTGDRSFEYVEDRIFTFIPEQGGDSMARVFYTEKQPNENLTYVIDFTDELSSLETVTDVDTTAYDQDGTSCWSVIGGGSSIATDGKSVNVGVIGGVTEYQYHVNVICTLNTLLPNTTDYTKLEADLYITVLEL